MPFTSPIFMKLKHDRQLFVKNSYNKFLEKQNNSLVPVTGSWTGEQTRSPQKDLFIYFVQCT
jgi:hypothetical protein